MKKTLAAEIKHREHTSISFSQIQKILTPHSLRKSTVMKELDHLPEHCKDSDIFGSATSVCLFCNRYINGRVVASHWVVLLYKKRKHGRNIVEFCDPLGNSLEALMHILRPPKMSLLWWKKNRRGKVVSSTVRFQNDALSDCGDHAAVRICLRQLNNRQYAQFLKHGGLNTDIIVSLLSFLPLMNTD